MRKMILAAFMLGCASAAGAADAPIIDNERVMVRDITLTPGADTVTPDPDHPFVIAFLDGGTISTMEDGKTATKTVSGGNAVYGTQGTHETITASSGHPRLFLVTLKEAAATPLLPNTSGLPLAFPRPGAVKILENDRVTVWNYSWVPSQPTAKHFHDKDTVVIFRQEGSVSSTTPDGKVTVNDDHTGSVSFNLAGRIHSEELVKGQESGIMVELK